MTEQKVVNIISLNELREKIVTVTGNESYRNLFSIKNNYRLQKKLQDMDMLEMNMARHKDAKKMLRRAYSKN